MKSIKPLLPAILFLLFASINAQDQKYSSTNQNVQIKSTFLNEERDIGIYLPSAYHSSDKSYPVLYLLDGNTHFQHAVGAVSPYLQFAGSYMVTKAEEVFLYDRG